MEITNTLLLIFLELTFVFVVMLLLHSQKKSIGDIPFFVVLGMLLVFGEFLAGSEMSFNALDYVSFKISPVVVFVPFMAAMLILDEDTELYEKLFERWCDALASISAEIPFVKGSTADVYPE